MATVSDLLGAKTKELATTSPQASVFDAIKDLSEKNVGALLVTDPSGKLVGIISERDYARKVILKGKSSKETQVKDIMTTNVVYVSASETVDNCMALMINKYIRHLPVLENGKLIGIISIGDVVKSVIGDREFRIAELEKYISS